MKVLIDSYNTVSQNNAGGVQMRIKNMIKYCKKYDVDVKLFNKWEDKLENYDILHIFKLNIESYNLIIQAKKKGLKIVISTIFPIAKKWTIYFNKLMCKVFPIYTPYAEFEKIIDLSDFLVAQTDKEAEFLLSMYPNAKNKIGIIPNGVNDEIKNVNETIFREYTGIKGDYVLQVGRFDKNKNQINVIRAMANTDITVVFIGGQDNSELEYFENCKKEATGNIHFLGWIDNGSDLLKSAYKGAKVVILPSYKEIFGNALIEGGAGGANLIATEELPIEEWGLDKYCDRINPNDIEDIKKKIIENIHKKRNEELSRFVYEKFSWDRVVGNYIKIYKKLRQEFE